MAVSTIKGESLYQDVAPTPESFDIAEDRNALALALVGSNEIDQLTSKIDVNNLESIVVFGAESAEQIAKSSDFVLKNMNMAQLDESSAMLKSLATIMSKFDINEIKEEPGFLTKLFGGAKKQLEHILSKYQTMGKEVDKIYIELRKYEGEIKKSNQTLEDMFQTNLGYYHDLVKYIFAGEQACKEITDYIAQREMDYEKSGDGSIQIELTSLRQALQMMEQRTQDLRTAENVAIQSLPMLKAMEFANMNLVRKINSAFIITLPVFKQALAQAVLLKKQAIQAEALSALDEKTNQMLLLNAQNTSKQITSTTRMATSSSIQIETLEEAWRTITNGIAETRSIQEEARMKREEDKKKLEALNSSISSTIANT